ncbi:MAG: DivIVA domain-containing protein [Solirubrobacteraceae bacterium]
MSYFNTPDIEEQAQEELREPTRTKFTELGGRVARWFAGLDDEREDWPTSEHDPLTALGTRIEDRTSPVAEGEPDSAQAFAPAPDPTPGSEADDAPARFELAPFGYNRTAVDAHVSALERELEELRSRDTPPLSITEELERIGEQTASILVVAHDKAHETTRLAEEQAERCIADAASNAVAITDRATRRLRELDEETDQVWQERERLLEDVRGVSAALTQLADRAVERFPAEAKPLQPTEAFDPFEGIDAPM